MIEDGVADPSDPTLKERIAAVKTERDIAKAAFERAVGELRPEAQITAERIAAFTKMMQDNIRHGEIAFRRAYIRAVVDQIEVDDRKIGIRGRRSVLERLVMGGGVTPAGAPSVVSKWRAGEDETGRRYVIAGPL